MGTLRTIAAFLALVFGAINLAPSIAHVASLPNKIDMPEQVYFAAQRAYFGWAWFGLALGLAIAANLWFALASRRHRAALVLGVLAVVLLLGELGVFFGWVQPANAATLNWVSAPSGWQMLRTQWEYGHAVIAGLAFAAFCCTALAAAIGRR
jgi:hypothetical protein